MRMVPDESVFSLHNRNYYFINYIMQIRKNLKNDLRDWPSCISDELANIWLKEVMNIWLDIKLIRKRFSTPFIHPKVNIFPIPQKPRRFLEDIWVFVLNTTLGRGKNVIRNWSLIVNNSISEKSYSLIIRLINFPASLILDKDLMPKPPSLIGEHILCHAIGLYNWKRLLTI